MHAVRLAALAVALSVATAVQAADMPPVGVVAAPGVGCPAPDAVQAALGRLPGRPGGAPAPSYRLFVDRTGDQVHVDLRDGANRSVLARDLQVAATDCEHAAQAIALIVERHFRAIAWSPDTASAAPPLSARAWAATPAPAATSPPATSAPANPAPAAPGSTTPSSGQVPAAAPAPVTAMPGPAAPAGAAALAASNGPAPARPPLLRFAPAALPRLAFGVGPAFWSRGDTFAVALGGRWRVFAGSPFEVGLGALLPPSRASGPVGSGGAVHVSAVPLAASLGLAAALGPLATAVHAGGLWTIERGQSEAIPDAATAWRTIFGLGLGISAAWPITPRLRLTTSLDGYRTVLGRSYAVAGVSGAVLEPPPWQLIAALGAEWVVSP